MTPVAIMFATAPADSNGGGRDPFADAIVALRHSLHQRALFLAQDRSRAEDLLQQTLERALASRHQFLPGTNLRAWLCSIMRNLFIDGRRHEASARQVHEAHPGLGGRAASGDASAETAAADVDEPSLDDERETDCGPLDVLSTEDIDAAIATLRPAQREIFQLAYRDHVSHRVIAARLGVRIATIGTRLFRARAMLRGYLEDRYQQRLLDLRPSRAASR